VFGRERHCSRFKDRSTNPYKSAGCFAEIPVLLRNVRESGNAVKPADAAVGQAHRPGVGAKRAGSHRPTSSEAGRATNSTQTNLHSQRGHLDFCSSATGLSWQKKEELR